MISLPKGKGEQSQAVSQKLMCWEFLPVPKSDDQVNTEYLNKTSVTKIQDFKSHKNPYTFCYAHYLFLWSVSKFWSESEKTLNIVLEGQRKKSSQAAVNDKQSHEIYIWYNKIFWKVEVELNLVLELFEMDWKWNYNRKKSSYI